MVILIVSEVSTNKINICSKNSGIFLSAMNKSSQLYKFSSKTQLEFAIYGQGERSLICFHGFGQDHSVFKELSSYLTNYQVVGINLLFHGESDRGNERKYMHHEEWEKIMEALLDQLNIRKFSVLGYSMGGRYAVSTIRSFSDRIDHCFLIAPDGIVRRSSYEFATFPYGPQQLFGFFMNNPRLFFIFLNLVEKTKLVNQWTINFSKNQLNNEDQRRRVFKSWVTLKKLRLSQKKLVALVNTASHATTFIFGKHDNIIKPKSHFSFFNKLQNSKVIILDTGHTKLLDESISTISEKLNTFCQN